MGYCVQQIVSWYQKKIGTYDKQEWEKTVEQRILSGFTHVPKKTAKLKTELIDVDLVRGSSFTKAKPKGGLMTVTRLGIIRLLFLPAYAEWWCSQTSSKLFALLLLLYILQVINTSLYFLLPEETIQLIPGSEVAIPGAMMVLLTILHSHIVSPRSAGGKELAPFDTKARRIKRTKRRGRLSSDKLSDPSVVYGGFPEATSKFSKRVRLRKLSFEDSSKTSTRRRRSVAWDTSPSKLHLSLNESDRNQSPEPPMMEEAVGGGSPGDDDGFESLNSQGSSEDVQAVPPPEGPEAVFRNNWLEQSARRASIGVNEASSGETDHKDSDSDNCSKSNQRLLCRRRGSQQVLHVGLPPPPAAVDHSSCNSSEEEGGEGGSLCPALTEGTTSAAEWIGITTNSDDCSVSSEGDDHPFASEFHTSPCAILSPSCAASDRVSCTMWEKKEVKKADLSVLDISSAIIARVEAMPENMDYFYVGMLGSVLAGLVPALCRLVDAKVHKSVALDLINANWTASNYIGEYLASGCESAFGPNKWTKIISLNALVERTVLSSLFFFLVTVAERTFKQRFLYAKFFSHLTSFRRARKSELPHFRLNKVRNIKTWLSVRSYLRKRGPQHSVDVIVSSVFLLTIFLLGFISVEYLKDSDIMNSQSTVEALLWGMILGCFLLRFMTLGTKINRKYRNLSVLITEQINLYLQIEQKPNKKEELMVANSVLKLAADLLKELECPYKISGISANPYLYTITKVVILSAVSGVLSEMLGFKLKLHKIKIK